MNHEPPLPDGEPNLLYVLKAILWGVAFLGIVSCIVGGYLMTRPLDPAGDEVELGNALAAVIGGFILALMASVMAVGLELFEPSSDEAAADTPPIDTPTTDIAPAPIGSAPSGFIDWTPALWIGAAGTALATLAFTGYLIVRTRHRILDRRAAADTLAADFEAAKAIYAQVAGAYAEYLADPYSIFTRPLLDDLDQPRTAAFIDAFAGVGALDTDTCPATPERVKAFADASRTALSAWNTADRHARAIGLGVLTDDSKRTVRRIHSALELALDDTAAAGERESAIEAVQRLSNGLITVPDRIYATAKTAIETVTRKQLTS
nr:MULTISPECIES: hypothetical protein [unclassified Rhodococcus (in: high G+C Gram-positive bacteria)]